MPAIIGRAIRIKYHSGGSGSAGVVLAYAKSDELSQAIEGVDASNKDAGGIRILLDDIGNKSSDLNFEGLLSDSAQHKSLAELANDADEGSAVHYFSLDAPDVGVWAGDWLISGFTITGADGAATGTFKMTLQSAGAITFTAAT